MMPCFIIADTVPVASLTLRDPPSDDPAHWMRK
jgi:hypothetical protein